MALKLTHAAQVLFFEKVFGGGHVVTQYVKEMVAAGWVFEVPLFAVKATYNGETHTQSLTTGSTSLIKGTAGLIVTQQNKTLISSWVTHLYTTYPPVPETPVEPKSEPMWSVVLTGYTTNKIVMIKTIRQITGLGLKDAKEMAEAAKGTGVTVGTYSQGAAYNVLKILTLVGGVAYLKDSTGAVVPVPESQAPMVFPEDIKLKPVPAVIALREAKVVGQKVKGTSTGSVYHTVAVNTQVRVAARILTGGSISIRAEWTGHPVDVLQKLTEAGLQMKTNYGSLHLNAVGVPYGRVVGGFVLGCGIAWDQVFLSSTDLVVE